MVLVKELSAQEKRSDYICVKFAVKSLGVPAEMFQNGTLEHIKSTDGNSYVHHSVLGPYLYEKESEWLSSPYSF